MMTEKKTPVAERQAWLDNLKVGDEVCVDKSKFGEKQQSIVKVTKITPTRKIRVMNYNSLFNKYGEYNNGWSYTTLEIPTQKIRQEIRDKNRQGYVKNTDWSQVSQDKINRIYEILKSELMGES